MIDAREDSHGIQDADQWRSLNRFCRRNHVSRIELFSPQRFRHVLDPPLELEPAVHVKNMPEDEKECNHSRPALECVADVFDVGILTDVPFASRHNHHADRRVEDDRQKNERPFQKHDRGRP